MGIWQDEGQGQEPESGLDRAVTPHRRVDGEMRFSHNTVAVLEAFATAIAGLHEALGIMAEQPLAHQYWSDSAYNWTRSAVRAARMLAVREDYR